MSVSSASLFEQAKKRIPGGVNSPVRAFGAVGGTPVFIREGHGSRVVDVEGREYIDLVGSWGPLILGHAHPEVVDAVVEATRRGMSFGAPTAAEVELAELICERLPSVEKVRLVNSGTEATMTAARLARGATGRDHLIKFAGNYHGHADAFLIQAGSGALTHGVPSSPGVPESVTNSTHLARFNDLDNVRALLEKNPQQIAAVLVEPIAGNMGCVPPAEGFLEGLRELCDEHGALLIFDEVMTGFRVSSGGAQKLYGIRPDLTAMGKVVGGGMPLGAVGGRAELMDHLSPAGPVYQAGTLSGNPLATAAGLATLRLLGEPGVYEELERKSARLDAGIRDAMTACPVPVTSQRVGSMSTQFFIEGPITSMDSLANIDTDVYAKYFHNMLERGVTLAPSQYEVGFVSLAHSDEDIDRIAAAAKESMAALA